MANDPASTTMITGVAGHNYLITSNQVYANDSSGIQDVTVSGTSIAVQYFGEFDVIDLGKGTGNQMKVFILTADGLFAVDEYDPAVLKRNALYSLANGKQDALTFDSTPTSGSTKPVTSGGIYTALGGKASITVSVTTPLNAAVGDFWFQPTTQTLHVYASNLDEWVEIRPTVDSAMSSTSTNPVQNRVIYSALGNKADTSQLTDGSVTKVGTANVGSATTPIYLNGGVPTAGTALADGAYKSMGSVASSNTGLVTGGDVYTAVSAKQDTLVSGTNIKTLNNQSILGSGNLSVGLTITTYGS